MNPHLPPSRLKGAVAYVSACTGVPVDLIMSKHRLKPIAHARQQVMWFLHVEGFSYNQIAQPFGCDHSSVVHAYQAVIRRGPARFRLTEAGVEKIRRKLLPEVRQAFLAHKYARRMHLRNQCTEGQRKHAMRGQFDVVRMDAAA